MVAEVQHGDVQQALFHQIQHIDYAAGAAIAIVEGVDAFKLVVDQRHFDQRVGIEQVRLIHEPLQRAHQRHDLRRVLRRGVDGLASAVF